MSRMEVEAGVIPSFVQLKQTLAQLFCHTAQDEVITDQVAKMPLGQFVATLCVDARSEKDLAILAISLALALEARE